MTRSVTKIVPSNAGMNELICAKRIEANGANTARAKTGIAAAATASRVCRGVGGVFNNHMPVSSESSRLMLVPRYRSILKSGFCSFDDSD